MESASQDMAKSTIAAGRQFLSGRDHVAFTQHLHHPQVTMVTMVWWDFKHPQHGCHNGIGSFASSPGLHGTSINEFNKNSRSQESQESQDARSRLAPVHLVVLRNHGYMILMAFCAIEIIEPMGFENQTLGQWVTSPPLTVTFSAYVRLVAVVSYQTSLPNPGPRSL